MNEKLPDHLNPAHPDFYGTRYYQEQLHRTHWFKDRPSKHRLRWNSAIEELEPSLDDKVLDLGCATGTHARALRPMVASVVGVDFSSAAIRLAEQQTGPAIGIHFIQSDVTSITALPSGSLDKAIALDLMEHLNDHQLILMLEDVWRILRPGGRLVFYTPCASHYVERLKSNGRLLKQLPGHIGVRTGPEYRNIIAKTRWNIAKMRYLPSSYPIAGIIDQMLMNAPWIAPYFRFRIVGTLFKS